MYVKKNLKNRQYRKKRTSHEAASEATNESLLVGLLKIVAGDCAWMICLYFELLCVLVWLHQFILELNA